ncbi:MAG: N-acetylmuramoyl-L-alanine amidase [Clostridium sp.]|nr:N-acetylmuramoyl-L-alanine amidase [Clostridium sp.]
MTVKGWALNPSGISKVNIYIDDVFKGNATIGQSRPDVANTFLLYTGAENSGYSIQVDISGLSEGTKTLKVEQVGKNGTKNITTTKFNIVKLKPIQVVDTPSNNSTVISNLLTVSGWSLSGENIKSINFYIDNTLIGNTIPNVSRTDVSKIYPQYPNAANSGFKKTLDISKVGNGTRTLRVEQVTDTGVKYNSEVKVNVSKVNPITTIDSPKDNITITKKSIDVDGWALNASGVKAINIYVDSTLVKTTKTGISRTDVKNVYPQYNDDKSGYKATIDLSGIANGKRVIKVEQVGVDGSKQSKTVTVNLDIPKLASKQDVNNPRDNSTITQNTLDVVGWSLSGENIKSINFYIDNNLIGSTIPNISRVDVAKVYPQYPNVENSGFKKTLDISSVGNGTRTLRVEQVTDSGAKYNSEVKINISRNNPITTIDSPKDNTTITKKSIDIGGWALNASGVKAINIYVDSTLVKTTKTGVSRIDVKNVYPQYNDDKSGYKATIDLSGIANGKRVIKVEQVGVDGSKQSKTVTVNLDIPKLSTIGNIDTPVANSNITTTKVKVSGWAVSDSGVKEVKVYVDGKQKGSSTVGISREDVGRTYPNHKNSNKSGYSVDIDINNIAPGSRTFEVKEISNDGSVHITSIKANIVKKSPVTAIDNPVNNYLEKSDTIAVSGWALNASGVNNVNIYVDGNKKVSVKPTISRSDVINVYPGYQTSNVCGYQVSVSLGGLVAGAHSILVEVVGIDGTINTVSRNIYYKVNTSKLIVIDPGHNHGGDDGAYATHNGVTYSERDINMDIAMKTKASLESIGYRVVLTRMPADREYLGVSESLTNRVNLANNLKADLFISIHQNSFSSESANGTEVYYTTTSNDSKFPESSDRNYKLSASKSLASRITNNISSIGFTNRGAKDGNLFVVRNTTMPAVLVECGFISNLKDVTNLTNSVIQERIASAIANSVKGNF